MARSKRTREVETAEWLKMAERIIRRAGERVADADEFELAELAHLRVTLDEAMRVAIRGQRTRWGRSWQHIGDALGITRQAAWQQYGDK